MWLPFIHNMLHVVHDVLPGQLKSGALHTIWKPLFCHHSLPEPALTELSLSSVLQLLLACW